MYSLYSACTRQAVRSGVVAEEEEGGLDNSCKTVLLVLLAGFVLPFLSLSNLFLGIWGLDSTLSTIVIDVAAGGGAGPVGLTVLLFSDARAKRVSVPNLTVAQLLVHEEHSRQLHTMGGPTAPFDPANQRI